MICIERRVFKICGILEAVQKLQSCTKTRKGANVKAIIRGLTVVSFILLSAFAASAAQSSDLWESLGQREVDFKNDHDRIDVGKSEGRFRQLRVTVKNAPIEIFDMVVTMVNDETFKPKVRHKFTEGSGSQVIDLPGERRAIKRIDFSYKSINRREGKGTVQVLAR